MSTGGGTDAVDRPLVIGFLHTADVHVGTFDELLARLVAGSDGAVVGRHVVRADLLDRARAAAAAGQAPDPGVAADLTDAVAGLAAGCSVVVVTCSTLGPYVDTVEAPVPLVRIDRPMAEQAIRLAAEKGGAAGVGPVHAGRVAYVVIVAALASAVPPARALVSECATAAGLDVRIGAVLDDDAWVPFERGDTDGYLTAVRRMVGRAAAEGPDVVLLAQASMAAVADPTGDRYGVPVLASPEPAVGRALELAVR